MNTLAPAYNNTQLILASFLTALQMFVVAAFFNQLTQTYSIIIIINSMILPLLMAKKTPRRMDNLISLLSTVVIIAVLGFFLAWLTTLVLPRTLIDENPVILDILSKLVALSVSLPPSILPFSFSLVLLVVLFSEKE